ncbi:MAG TPA: adenosine deaminase [Acidimicrobiales bacterium]|nr:adenosine deaminase [Acidimicrobiales bacterium]
MRDLATLPKAHLHLHLEGGMRPGTLTDLAAGYGVPVPRIRGFGSFRAFASTYLAACDVLRTEDDFTRLVDETLDDAADSGAVWIEVAFHPAHHRPRFGTDEQVVELVLAAMATASDRTGVGAGLMLSADRTKPPSDAVELAHLACRYANAGVVSFGLANDEQLGAPEAYVEAYAIARSCGLLSTPHAGELCGPDSVRGALDALGADRIQHGVRAIEDPALVARLADERVCLDVCPTSNLALGVVERMADHPLPALLDAGVPCSINADDPLLFGPGLLEEYELCRSELALDDASLAAAAGASIDHSAAPADVKAAALAAIGDWLA